MDKFNSPDYVRSRKSYIVQSTTEYFVSLLATDVFLAKLLTSIGISDGMVGVIASFTTLAFVFQILTLFLVKVKAGSKKLVMIFDTISIVCFMLMYIIPFLPVSKILKIVFLMLCILTAYLCKYLILNINFKWANAHVEPTQRASFSAVKEIISLVSGMIFTVVVGYIIDRFEAYNNISMGFLFIASTMLILNICNFISLALIKKEDASERTDDSEPISVVLQKTIGNKNFRSIIILTVLWNIANYFTIGFLGVFKSKDLMLSVFQVQIINIIANAARVLISRPLGRYSDRTSFSKGFKLGLAMLAAAYFFNIFTTKSTWYFIIVYTILGNCSVAGTNQNSYNMVYSYVDSKYITQAMAIKNCIGGLFGFGTSIVAGKILDTIQANNNMIFGVHIYGQQLLSAISFVLTLITILYMSKVVEKQRIMIQ